MARVDKQVNVRLEADILERLRAHAEDTGQSMTAALNRALEAAIPALPKSVKQVKVRIPSDLYERLQTSAKRNRVTANAEINRRLEATFL